MKYISTLTFLIAMIGSWNVIQSYDAQPFYTHAGIKDRLAELIKDTIKTKRPAASEVEIIKITTEPLNENTVKATFSFSYTEGAGTEQPTKSQIDGTAVLERQPKQDDGMDRWSLNEVHTTNDSVVFEQDLIVTPEKDTPFEAGTSDTNSGTSDTTNVTGTPDSEKKPTPEVDKNPTPASTSNELKANTESDTEPKTEVEKKSEEKPADEKPAN